MITYFINFNGSDVVSYGHSEGEIAPKEDTKVFSDVKEWNDALSELGYVVIPDVTDIPLET